MKRLLCLIVITWGTATPAQAYIDYSPTLRFILDDSTNIVVMQVEKVNLEKRIVLFKKVADLKGKHPEEQIKYQITDGLHPRESKLILDWAEPGRVALCFHNGKTALICLGKFWYESTVREAPWWNMTRGRYDLSLAYFGSAEKLRQYVSAILAGKEVVITAVAFRGSQGQSAHLNVYYKKVLRGTEFPIRRIRASLKMPPYQYEIDRQPRWQVGPGAGGPEDVPGLLQRLKHPEGHVRVEAAEELALLGPPAKAAVPALAEALKDSDERVRIRAAGALARIAPGHPAAMPILLQGMKAKSANLRKAVAETLGDGGLEIEAAIRALTAALKDVEPEVRWTAAESLNRIGPAAQAAVPALIAALKDESIRAIAADALGSIGAAAKTASPALAEILKQETDRPIRWIVGVALVRIDPPAARLAAPLFADGLKGPDTRLRVDSLIYLGLMGPAAKDAVPALAALLKDEDSAARFAAAQALSGIAHQAGGAVPALIEALPDTSRFVRGAVVHALLRIGLPNAKPAVPALIARLRDTDPNVRIASAEVLWQINRDTRNTIPVLIEPLQAKDQRYAGMAARVLTQVGPEAKAAVPALLEVFQGKDEGNRKEAAAALKKIDPNAATKAGIR